MGRIIAVDYGAKRCGVAITDPLKLSVNPRPVVSPSELLDVLGEYVRDGDVEGIVLTRSSHHDGSPNTIQTAIDQLAVKLGDLFPQVSLFWQDEFGSSREARRYLVQQGVGKKKRSAKGALDSVSAAIILERYLRDAQIW